MVNVSVLIPVYNGEKTLAESLSCVLSDQGDSVEVIALDDGSSDNSWAILESFNHPNLIKLRHPNCGLAKTLNLGLHACAGKYIARQDQDDLVLPNRLQLQAEFLEKNPDVAMVGTWAQIYVEDIPSNRFHRHPCSSDALKFELLFDNPFVHSSMMIRAEVLREVDGYCEDKLRQPPEDYELWSRIARKYNVANIPLVKTIYREMPCSMSRTGNSPFINNVIKISAENLYFWLGNVYSKNECLQLASLYHLGKSNLQIPSARKVNAMLKTVAYLIAGDKNEWSPELCDCYARIKKHLQLRTVRHRIPPKVIKLARWLKGKFWKG